MSPHLTDTRFIEYHGVLRAELNIGYRHFRVYTSMEDAIEDRRHHIKHVSDFVTLTLRAHRREAILPLARLLDVHKRTVCIRSLLDHCYNNPSMFLPGRVRGRVRDLDDSAGIVRARAETTIFYIQDCVQQDRMELAALPAGDILALRNKVLAHMDRTALIEGTVPDTFPNREQVERCFHTVDSMLNRWSSAFDAQQYSMDYQADCLKSGVDTLLDTLHRRP